MNYKYNFINSPNLRITYIVVCMLALFITSSCTVEKRRYTSGYHVEWNIFNKGKQVPGEEATNHSTRDDEKINESDFSQLMAEDSMIDSTSQENVVSKDSAEKVNGTISTDDSTVSPAMKNPESKRPVNWFLRNSQLFHAIQDLKIIDRKENMAEYNNARNHNDVSETNDARSTVTWIGLILMLLGLILYAGGADPDGVLFWIGLLIWLIGLLIPADQSSVPQQQQYSPVYNPPPAAPVTPPPIQYEDVVYLKNGGILHGTIIEQVPNVSIKIKTKDGNVFVYKMEEIMKMTKEETNK